MSNTSNTKRSQKDPMMINHREWCQKEGRSIQWFHELPAEELHARNAEMFVESAKPQAAGVKPDNLKLSNKHQATSVKRQASS